MNTDSFLIENDFPHSMKLDEYLKRIEEYPEIGVIDRGRYTIIQYNVAFPETFKSEYTREARGLIFDNKTKEVIRRPFHKFFNVNEKEHTQIEDLSQDQILYVSNKLDGTLIAPFIVDGDVIWGTKRVASIYHDAVEQFLSYKVSGQTRRAYNNFVRHCIDCGLTPLFEFHDPEFSGTVIVIRYEEAFLKLLGLRDMETGMYIDISDPMVFGSIKGNFPEIETVELLDKNSLVDIKKELEDSTGIEGRVIMLRDNSLVKIKSPWYCKRHRIKELFQWDHLNAQLALEISETSMDDVAPEMERSDVIEYENFCLILKRDIDTVCDYIMDVASQYQSKKEYGMSEKSGTIFDNLVFGLIGNPDRHTALDSVRSQLVKYTSKMIRFETWKKEVKKL